MSRLEHVAALARTQTMSVAAFIIAGLATLALATSPAWASCAQLSSTRDNADRADVVVYGRVTGVEGIPARPSRFVSVRVERVMKGAAAGQLDVGLGPSAGTGGGPAATSVDYEARPGTDHVLYLKQTAPAGFTTDACSGSHPGPPTSEEQALFGAGRTPPDRIAGGLGDARGDRPVAAVVALAALAAAVGAAFFAFSAAAPAPRPGGSTSWPALAGGVGAGVAIAIATWAAERSRIAFGPFALFGNGALGIPPILVPTALFIGWTTLMRGRDRAPKVSMALYALGLIIGSAAWGILDKRLPGIVGGAFTGVLFVVPTAILAAGTIALFRSGRVPTNAVAVSTALVLGTLALLIPPLSSLGGFGIGGIAAGATTVAASRSGGTRIPAVGAGTDAGGAIALGAALLALMLAQVFALPILGQLFA